ncbi:hypothetical protein [Streptomyces sp. NBC_01190]|uniref:hypothetical protein n=1 Tax=Streptomyces sp. NBC_01190 TaxID=2903767 RepID=UPI0038667178|nr:hypothetical protein OG519_09625 [Streptomyces sp. NBC_01190]
MLVRQGPPPYAEFTGPPARPSAPLRRWPGYALVASGIALVPWLVVLATGLPPTATAPHWATAWVGLDTMEAVGLIATGLLTLRRHRVRSAVAGATATLLAVDAWFDVMTSSGPDFRTALAMAFAAEIPLAAICGVLAVTSFPRPASNPAHPTDRTDRTDRIDPARPAGQAAGRRTGLGIEPVRRPEALTDRAVCEAAGQQPSSRPPR